MCRTLPRRSENVIWTLIFVVFSSLGGDPQPSAIGFHSAKECDVMRQQLLDNSKDLPQGIAGVVVGPCVTWTNPDTERHAESGQ